MVDLTQKPHPMNGPPLPVRATQLVVRGAEEGNHSYKMRCWQAEFSASVSKIEDVNVRNALIALRQIT
jgi:hypothetical protein